MPFSGAVDPEPAVAAHDGDRVSGMARVRTLALLWQIVEIECSAADERPGHVRAAVGCFVSTVGRDEAVIRECIRNQEKENARLEQLNLWR